MGTYCEICKEETKYTCHTFVRCHLNHIHNMSNKEYYDTYLKKDGEDICQNENCNNKTKFYTMTDGYRRFCTAICGVKSKKIRNQISDTLKLKENYNIKSNYWAYKTEEESNVIKKQISKTVKEKNDIIQAARKKTYENKSEEDKNKIYEKIQKTMLERYGEERKIPEGKRKSTCMRKYGVDNIIRSDEERLRREESGLWRKKCDIPEIEIYYEKSNWKKGMWNYCDSEKLKTYGIFNPRMKKNGLVRDHILSRIDGFYENIPPILLRHPCNCQFITNVENIKKRSDSYLSIEELCSLIENYTGYWFEQEECIIEIKNYLDI